MKTVKVFSPATVANVACGFDAMGFAFEGAGDLIEMRLIDGDEIEYKNISGVALPEEREKNLMTPALRAIMDDLGERRGVEVTVIQKILPGSGIGSSASAASSAVFGYNALVEGGYTNEELINFALEGERMASGATHADNVAPAMLGGVVLVRDYTPLDIVRIKPAKKLYCAIVHPFIEVKTKDSRSVLRPEIPMSVAVRQWANLGSMVAGMLQGDLGLISRSLQDHVAEPYRKKFIPGYDILKLRLSDAGVLGSNISGSGPSVFALCESKKIAERAVEVMKNHFTSRGIECETFASPISEEGTRLIN